MTGIKGTVYPVFYGMYSPILPADSVLQRWLPREKIYLQQIQKSHSVSTFQIALLDFPTWQEI